MIDYSTYLVEINDQMRVIAELMRRKQYDEARELILEARSNLAKVHGWILAYGVKS